MSQSRYELIQYSSGYIGDIESEGKYSDDSYSENIILHRSVPEAGYLQRLQGYCDKIIPVSIVHIVPALLILSWSLTGVLSGYLIYQSTRKGPGNPISLQVLYCKPSRKSSSGGQHLK